MSTDSPSAEPVLRLSVVGRGLLLGHLLLSPLLFSRRTVEAFEFNKAALLQLTALALFVGGLIHLLRRPRLPALELWRDPVCVGFGLFWLSALASTLTSVNPFLSLRGSQTSHLGLLTVSAYVVLFFATRSLCASRDDAEQLLRGCVLATAVVVTYALVQWLGADPIHWIKVSQIGAYCRPFSTLGHANILAAWLTLALPVVVWWTRQGWTEGDRLRTTSGAVLIVMSVAVVGLSLSRAGWLALAVTVGVLLLGWKVRRGMRLAAVGVCLVAVAGVAIWLACSPGCLSSDTLGQRVGQLREVGPRRHIWDAAWRLTQERPATGWGLDTFAMTFPRQRTADYWHAEWNTVPERAHNMVFQVLATQGGVGAAAGLILLSGLAWAGWRALGRANEVTRPLALLCLAGLAGFLAQGLFGFTTAACGGLAVTYAALLSRLAAEPQPQSSPSLGWDRPALAITAVIVLAVLGDALVPSLVEADRRAPFVGLFALLVLPGCVLALLWRRPASLIGSEEPQTEPAPAAVWSLAALGLSGLAVLVVWQWFVPQYQAELACAEGLARWEASPIQALAHLEEAAQADPRNEFYWSQLGLAAEQAARGARRREHRQGLLEQALEAHRRAAVLVPDHPEVESALSRVLAGLERFEEAAVHRDRALFLDPSNPYLRADAVETALREGQPAEARAHLQRGLAEFPDFEPLQTLQRRLSQVLDR